MNFSWDETKKAKVLAEHKVDFARIVDVFEDPFAIEAIDEIHSTVDDVRFTIIGLTRDYGLIFLVFTEPSETELRFVTARKAEPWMKMLYDKERSKR